MGAEQQLSDFLTHHTNSGDRLALMSLENQGRPSSSVYIYQDATGQITGLAVAGHHADALELIATPRQIEELNATAAQAGIDPVTLLHTQLNASVSQSLFTNTDVITVETPEPLANPVLAPTVGGG